MTESCTEVYFSHKPQGFRHAPHHARSGGADLKNHLLVDACGNPVHFELGPGNDADVTVAPELLKNMD